MLKGVGGPGCEALKPEMGNVDWYVESRFFINRMAGGGRI